MNLIFVCSNMRVEQNGTKLTDGLPIDASEGAAASCGGAAAPATPPLDTGVCCKNHEPFG